MLLFKRKFLDAIRRGAKTQTIRLWKHRHMRSGQRSYIPGVGYILVHTVEPVEVSKLTDEDALHDGFDSAAALQQELQHIYAEKLAGGYAAWRVRFSLLAENDA